MAKVLVGGAGQMEACVQVVSQGDGRQHLGAARPGTLPHRQRSMHGQRTGMKAGTRVLHAGVLSQLAVHPRRDLGRTVAVGTHEEGLGCTTQFAGVPDEPVSGELVSHERDPDVVDEHRLHEIHRLIRNRVPTGFKDLLSKGSGNAHRYRLWWHGDPSATVSA